MYGIIEMFFFVPFKELLFYCELWFLSIFLKEIVTYFLFHMESITIIATITIFCIGQRESKKV